MNKRIIIQARIFIYTAVVFVTAIFAVNPAQPADMRAIASREYVQQFILREIERSYVDSSISMTELYDGAIQGIIGQLDPHSCYLPPAQADAFGEKIRGNFEGIGITFAMIDDKITVVEVIEGGPSEAAGLQSRDKIVRVDGRSVVGLPADSVKVCLRGTLGSWVNVHVERPGESGLLPFTIIRDRVRLDSVSYAFMLDDTTGMIALSRFSTNTQGDVSAALDRLAEQGMKRLVLDLRNNSGGSLPAAVGVVDLFLTEGVIVRTAGKRDNDNQVRMATGYAPYPDLPMIVLINNRTASASEIVAGALQDHDRALILGQTSFGKGLVMNSFPVSNNGRNLGVLMLSVAHYFTPSGRLIQRSYENGKEDYLREGYDDYDPNASDSTSMGQTFLTDLGRKVYGGGGITPDIRLDDLKDMNPLEVELRKVAPFFECADLYMREHADIPDDFNTFLASWRLPPAAMTAFRTFVTREKGIELPGDHRLRDDLAELLGKYDINQSAAESAIRAMAADGFDVSSGLFEKSADFIQREIKGEIARVKWGPDARYKVWQTDDTQLAAALPYFADATDLLLRRISLDIEGEAREHAPGGGF